MVVPDTPAVKQARRSMLEFLLTNHRSKLRFDKAANAVAASLPRSAETVPAGVDTSRSGFPIVFFDAPRALCYRCVHMRLRAA
jgi:hypothetical protein